MRRASLFAAAALLGLAVAALWAVRSETALRFALIRAAALTGGRVEIEGVSGSLLGPLRAERVVFTSKSGSRTTAERVEVAPGWRKLTNGALWLDAVTIDTLAIAPSPPNDEPPTVPETLALPFALVIERVEIVRLTIAERTELRAIRGSLRLGRDAHEATLARLTSPWGGLAGQARVETKPPFALSGEVAYARRALPRARLRVLASGPLTRAKLALSGSLDDAPVTGTATLASFERPWLGAVVLRGEHVDSAAFVRSESAPHADLAVTIDVRGDESALFAGTLRVANAKPGPLSQRALPLRTLASALRFADGALRFSEIEADLGPAGAVRGEGTLAGGELALALRAERLDAHALHESLRATRLAGTLDARLSAARIEGTLALREKDRELRGRIVREGEAVRAEDVRIAIAGGDIAASAHWDGARAFGAQARFSAFDPAALGDFPSASLSGELDASGELGDAWSARLTYALKGSRFRGRALDGRGALTLETGRVSHADASLRLGANVLRARGAFGAPADALALTLDAPDLAALGGAFGGSLALEGRLLGTREQPGGELTATALRLTLPGGLAVEALDARARIDAGGARALRVALSLDDALVAGNRIASATLRADGTLAAHTVALDADAAELALRARFSGGWDGAWSGRVEALETTGRVAALLIEPAPLRVASLAEVDFGPARIAALGGELALGTFALRDRRVETAGVVSDVALAQLLAALGRDPATAGDLRVRGVWVVPLDAAPLGVSAFSIDAALGASVAHVTASVAGERLGEATLRADLQAAPGRALLARGSALDAKLDAEVDSIRALGGLLGISARVDGRGTLALEASGTVGAPALRGAVQADALRFDWPSAGIALRDGTLRAQLTPQAVRVDALSFSAATGTVRAQGTVPIDGAPAHLTWEADHLRVLDRPDRNLEVTGKGDARLDGGRLGLSGKLRANSGYIEVPRVQQSRLGEDVIVLGREQPAAGPRGSAQLDLDLELDAGKKLRIVGAGLDTLLSGKLRVKTLPSGALVAFGEIDATSGTYRAFGQKLEIERGALIFNGAIDDPALDVLALRKNLPVEAGVELTGTLKTPLARLVSNPPVPDSEKLSWLVLGHAVSDASAADTALLQAATATIFSGDGGPPLSQRVARGVGLDEISLKSTGEQASTEASDRAVALGKRLSDKVYLEYEYGLEAASHLVRLHYALTRALSVRVETSGDTGNLGVNYRKSWD